MTSRNEIHVRMSQGLTSRAMSFSATFVPSAFSRRCTRMLSHPELLGRGPSTMRWTIFGGGKGDEFIQ
jgi:hypothetical protein